MNPLKTRRKRRHSLEWKQPNIINKSMRRPSSANHTAGSEERTESLPHQMFAKQNALCAYRPLGLQAATAALPINLITDHKCTMHVLDRSNQQACLFTSRQQWTVLQLKHLLMLKDVRKKVQLANPAFVIFH